MKSIYIALIVCLSFVNANAQPGNDSCAQLVPQFTMEPVTPFGADPPTPVCLSGATINALPENIVLNDCDLTLYNVVWYQINTDVNAATLNLAIDVTGVDPFNPLAALFTGDCMNLIPVALNGALIDCMISAGSSLNIPQIVVLPNQTYFLAVGSETSPGGNFDVCVSTEMPFQGCINNHELMIIARENNLPLTDPFFPGELITFSYHVEYGVDPIGVGNECQWLQGIIPVLGDGWEYDHNVGIQSYVPGFWSWYPAGEVDYNWVNYRYSSYTEGGNLKIAHYSGDTANYHYTDRFVPGTLLPGGWYAVSPGNSLNCIAGSTDPDETYGAPAACGSVYILDIEFSIRIKADFMQGEDNLKVAIYEFSDGSIGCWNQQRCALDLPVVYDNIIVVDSVLNISLPNTANCVSDMVLFQAHGSNAPTFNWMFEGGSPATSTDAAPLVTYAQSGIYDVCLTAIQNGASYTYVWEDTVVIENEPVADFILDINSLTNMSTNATAYTWFVDGNFQSNDEHISIFDQGNYEVMLIASNSCGSDTLTQQIFISATSSLPVFTKGMKVLPNPNSGSFVLAFDQPIGVYDLSIIDIQGRAIYQNRLDQQNQNVSLQALSSSMYIIRAVAEHGVYMDKMIVVE